MLELIFGFGAVLVIWGLRAIMLFAEIMLVRRICRFLIVTVILMTVVSLFFSAIKGIIIIAPIFLLSYFLFRRK